MSKTKIVTGGIAVIAAVAIGAHFLAPSFFEGRFRTHLTSPDSGLAGTFDNFELSLFGGTMSATNISLRDSNGVNFSADSIQLENVNWLTLLNANPFGNVLAKSTVATNSHLEIGPRQISSPEISLGALHIIKWTDVLEYAADDGAVIDLKMDLGPDLNVTADHVAFENITPQKFGNIAFQNLQYINPQSTQALALETMAADNCTVPQEFPVSEILDNKPFDFCEGLSGTGIIVTIEEEKRFMASGFGITQFGPSGVQAATLSDLEIIEDDKVRLRFGTIDLRDVEQSLRRDVFDDDRTLDAREWQHLIDNLSVGHFSMTNLVAESKKGSGKLDTLAIDGFKNGQLEKLAFAGVEIAVDDDQTNPRITLGNFEISKLSLNRLRQMFEVLGASSSGDPTTQMQELMSRTIGDTGVLISPMIYETFVFSDLSFSGNFDIENRFSFGLERANGSLGAPVLLEGSNVTFAKKGRTAYEGLYFEVSDQSPVKPIIASILGVEDFERVSMNGKGNILWDEEAGIYTYDLEDASIDNIGSISLSFSISNLTRDVMTKMLATRLNQTEKLQEIGLAQAGFGGARLEIKGEKLVEMFFRLAAQGKGQSPEELQMIGTMTLMQTQQNFAPFPKLSQDIGELATWLSNPQHLVISLAPDEPVPFGVIASGSLRPDSAADLMGLTILANDNIK